jgi:perosamine synthetase
MKVIPFGKPMIGIAERDAMAEVLCGTVLTHGPQCAEFEKRFSEFVGVKHAITTSNCTTAIHLGLVACGVGVGDEVIVPALTHVATAHAVEHCGAKPVFVDIEFATGCINPELIEDSVTEKTKAIIVVHFIGLPCDMNSINVIAKKHGLFVIEDSATALGARYGEVCTGALGKFGCFSFYPTKHITSLEGGMLTTNDDDVAEKVKSQRAFGYDKALGERTLPGLYDIKSLGWNYRMSEGHAAVGRVQLSRCVNFLKLRQKNAELLSSGINGIRGLLTTPLVKGPAKSSWYCVNLIVTEKCNVSRDEFVKLLNSEGVGTSIHYPVALPFSKYYSEKYPVSSLEFRQAKRLAMQTVSLPCGPHVSTEEIEFMIEKIEKIARN